MQEQIQQNDEFTVKIIVFSFIVLMFLFVFYHIKNPIETSNIKYNKEIQFRNNF